MKPSYNVPGPPKPNPSLFSMTKINITNSIIFVTDSIAMSHIDNTEDDVADDMDSNDDVDDDIANYVAAYCLRG